MLILLLKEYSWNTVLSSKFPQSRGISANQLILISTICSEIPKDAACFPTNSFFRLEAVKFPRRFPHLAKIQKTLFRFSLPAVTALTYSDSACFEIYRSYFP